jgi:Reverse transcriptase (RNA-dependent DNA polymerase)
MSIQASSLTINCYYQNARGLNTKTTDFLLSSSLSEFHLIAITESWLQSNVMSSELFDANYLVFRQDRNLAANNVSRGGGVMLGVREDCDALELNLTRFRNLFSAIDLLGVKLIHNFKTIYVFVVYVPPNVDINQFQLFLETLECLEYLLDANMLVLGDFNQPSFVSRDDPLLVENSSLSLLRQFENFFDLKQYNPIHNSTGRILDLVYSNINCTIQRNTLPFIAEDRYHPALEISLSLQNCTPNVNYNENLLSYNFKRADFHDLYNEILITEWDFLESIPDVDDALNRFYSLLYEIINKHVPRYPNFQRKYPPWFSKDIISKIKQKNKLFQKIKRFNLDFHKKQFQLLRKKIKTEIKFAYQQFVSESENSIIADPSKFWDFIHSKKGTSRIPGILQFNGVELNTPSGIVNGFANFFSSVYSIPNSVINCNEVIVSNNPTINIDSFSEEEVAKALCKLKDKHTSGHDNIPSFFARDCAYVLAKPLQVIFNTALKTNTFPKLWKVSKVIPIFKSGEINDIGNYRPITLLSNFAKAFEISVYTRIFPKIQRLISTEQHGFITNRSTVTNLMSLSQSVCQAVENHSQLDVIYTDFSKAFDRLDHTILISKLNEMGLTINLLQFFSSYLTNRKQFVEYRGHQSYTFVATSGAPQGSNLAPLLFSIFINDIGKDISSDILLFADDLKLFKNIRTVDDCRALQVDLDTLCTWCVSNNLPLNLKKCNYTTYTLNRNIISYHYNMNNCMLENNPTPKDLGVLFDSRLSFTPHINQTISSAKRMLGLIFRNSKDFSNQKSFLTLYEAFVRSRLEYGCLIWAPIYAVHIQAIESVQRQFMKYMSFRLDGTYPQRGISNEHLLQRFSLLSLDDRRTLYSCIFLYKLIHNLVDSPSLLSQLNYFVPRLHSRSEMCFYLATPRTDILRKAPLYAMCCKFNKICHKVDIFKSSLVVFKKDIKHILLQA